MNIPQSDINDICSILLKAPSKDLLDPFFKVSRLLTHPLKVMTSFFTKESPLYQYESDTTDENAMYEKVNDLDKYIEGNSFEYKWSPHPELESAESLENVQDTPEESYSADDKRDICKYLHEECKNHMQAGLCSDKNAQAQGMKKFCKTTCGFCV
ncbi:uncharacterized protein LOC114534955 [Dendronephthya gigantea]|uniref:uncharacterized protein LOC114534955 n=1 Tax=Dendronephthya gigantea TaxID=151771 RepID=UPI00106CCDDF|nr:uncharacterized protein LOC114534955 [Dendronephthya gigantea]